MKLSDVVGHAGLSGYAQVALVLFLVAFVAIIWWVFRPGARARWPDACSPSRAASRRSIRNGSI